jgi:Predicted hydrolases or acyltransferases (alpha/beta hydrolase superfamily)
MRGFGKSEWEPPEFDFEYMVGDLAAVVDAAGVERCDLLGISHGSAIAIAYAARHPERVRKLVLVNSFAAGWRVRADPEEVAWRESLSEMNRASRAFAGACSARCSSRSISRRPTSADRLAQRAVQHAWAGGEHDQDDRGRGVDRCPPRAGEDQSAGAGVPRQQGRQRPGSGWAAGRGRDCGRTVRRAESANHVLLGDEPAWPVFVREMRGFLGSD